MGCFGVKRCRTYHFCPLLHPVISELRNFFAKSNLFTIGLSKGCVPHKAHFSHTLETTLVWNLSLLHSSMATLGSFIVPNSKVFSLLYPVHMVKVKMPESVCALVSIMFAYSVHRCCKKPTDSSTCSVGPGRSGCCQN